MGDVMTYNSRMDRSEIFKLRSEVEHDSLCVNTVQSNLAVYGHIHFKFGGSYHHEK